MQKLSKLRNFRNIHTIRNYEQKFHNKLKVVSAPFKNFVQEYTLNGNFVYVCSSQDGSYHSLQQNLAVMEQINPKNVLLDTISNSTLKRWTQNKTQESLEQSLLAKQKYSKLFITIFPKQREYYTVHDNNTYVYLLRDRNIEFKDQLSVAYYAVNDPKTFILTAKPDEIHQIEDIVCNYTLKELKDAFLHTIEQIKISILHQNAEATDSFNDILYLFRNQMMKNHSYLYENYINYQVALLQKSSRVVDKSCLFTSQFFSEQIVKISKEKFYDYTKYYELTIPSNQKDELLEKIVIAGYIIDYELRLLAMQGQNPFENTIFKNYLNSQDIPKYLQLHQFYSDQLYNLQNFIIQSVLLKQPQKSQQYTFEETIKTYKRQSQTFNYQFDIMQVSQIKQGLVLQQLFSKQINKILQVRMMQGINQKDVLKAIQNISQDIYTQKDLQVYLKLITEANAELGFPIKFPGSLRNLILPYLNNIQVEKTSRIASGLTFQSLTNKLSYAQLPKKQIKNDEFTDDEEDNEHQNRFILSANENAGQVPEELKNMSFEQIKKIADEQQHIKFKMNQEGEYEIDEQQSNFQPTQEQVDKILSGHDIDEKD